MERNVAARELAFWCMDMFHTTPGIGEHLEMLANNCTLSRGTTYEALGDIAVRSARLAKAAEEGHEPAVKAGGMLAVAEAALLITIAKTDSEILALHAEAAERATLLGLSR